MPDEWYYTQDGRGRGPVSEARLKQLLEKGQLRPNDILWKEGMTEKVRVEDLLAALEHPEEALAALPGPAEAEAPPPAAPPVGGLDRLGDEAASQPAGPATPEPVAASRHWHEPPPRRAGPQAETPPAPPAAEAAPAAEAKPQAPPEQASSAGTDVEPLPAGSDLAPPAPAPEPAGDRPAPPAAGPPEKAPRNLALIGSFALSACALVLALVALGLHVFADPLGPGLARYDLTTPRAALVSQMQIRLHHDVRAALELEALARGDKLQEKLDTLKVEKEADWTGARILFVSYQEDGVKRHGTAGFEKNGRTGFWAPVPVSVEAVREQDPDLAKQMESWEKEGHF